MKVCEHFLNLKQQKIANFIKKSQLKCAGSKNHLTEQYQLCMQCGEIRCQSQQCSYKHYSTYKHPIVLNLVNRVIYCFICKQFVHQLTEQIEGHKQNKQTQKKISRTFDLLERILNFAIKNPPKQSIIKPKMEMSSNIIENNHPKVQKIKKQNKQNKLELKVFGLANIGNTCYFNSILQCIYAAIPVHQSYMEIDHNQEDGLKFSGELSIIFKKFLKNQQKVYCPKNLFSAVCKGKANFRIMEQQDALQLYGILLNSLIDAQKKSLKLSKQLSEQKNKLRIVTSIQKIFGFYLASRLSCLNCGKISWSIDFSLDLSVEIGKNSAQKIQLPQDCEISKEQIGFQGYHYPILEQTNTFIDQFFAPESFSKVNYFKCQSCGSPKAIRKFYMKQPPQILTISLKRFNNNGTKNNINVKVPQILNINSHTINLGDYNYEVYGGVIHSGSAKGGHYVAYTRRDSQWFYFSDSHIKPSSFDKFKLSQPYLLFYQRINNKE